VIGESVSAVSLALRKPTILNNYLEFLGECEAICETALEPVNQGGLIDEEKKR
jgi:hypothetical protein